jgi:hypothetical protein
MHEVNLPSKVFVIPILFVRFSESVFIEPSYLPLKMMHSSNHFSCIAQLFAISIVAII